MVMQPKPRQMSIELFLQVKVVFCFPAKAFACNYFSKIQKTGKVKLYRFISTTLVKTDFLSIKPIIRLPYRIVFPRYSDRFAFATSLTLPQNLFVCKKK